MRQEADHTWIKAEAKRQGFLACGIATAGFLQKEAYQLDNWLKRRKQATMSYMARNLDKRLDPRKLVPGATSVISLLYNYAPKKDFFATKKLKVARYAYGQDYHPVVRARLRRLFDSMVMRFGDIQGRYFVDSAPVHERAWAQRAGLGWIGRNTLLLRKGVGSFFFIAEIICDLPLAADLPAADHCGSCQACVDACPTQALSLDGQMDPARCLSYQTIEHRGPLRPEGASLPREGWIFGCDRCQEVCPWNRFATPHTDQHLQPLQKVLKLPTTHDKLDNNTFDTQYKHTALHRAGWNRLKENISLAQQKP